MKRKRLLLIVVIAFSILAVPLIAMQFSSEVDWTVLDFIVAGILLFSVGFFIEFILRRVMTKQQRLILCLIAIIVFLLIWVELAVGIFGTSFSGS